MNDREFEHRLTKIEERGAKIEDNGVALQSQIAIVSTDLAGRLDHITSRIEAQSISLSDHYAADLAWQHLHDLAEREAIGVAAGRKSTLGMIDRLLVLIPGAIGGTVALYAMLTR